MAEATGVFFYVFPGIASVAGFTINVTSPIGVTAFGSLFQIGWAFAIGIAFAIITCAPTSGGHFNPWVSSFPGGNNNIISKWRPYMLTSSATELSPSASPYGKASRGARNFCPIFWASFP